ncbi:DUF3833 domain-containing protein [Shewanella avicenniae]|uniref:DUF3833 domain-containing protein n=1 Tax=Shewanella avicenniae TaxID=2814294 RepID=A0ABX7QSW0_9GAMM|nr:DUF3833 domain-containing protein [Shewanella avicenniae]QSX34559.1 DUF3833 domain-containing protein [Shewanella avicenniae]
MLKHLLKRWHGLLAFILTTVTLTGCSSDLTEYRTTSPKFDLFDYFQGELKAWGMVQDYTGKQTRRFEVQIKGTVIGNTLTLDEAFAYDDGETDTRVWTITRSSDGKYIGQADDIIGEASGEEQGNALRWRYDFRLKTADYDIDVHFDDWMYRQDQHHVFNVSSISKWGIEVGKVTLFFTKLDVE